MMAVLAGTSVLLGTGPVWYVINADLQAAGLGAVLVMAALAGFLVSIPGAAYCLALPAEPKIPPKPSRSSCVATAPSYNTLARGGVIIHPLS